MMLWAVLLAVPMLMAMWPIDVQLLKAVANGNLIEAQALIKKGANVNSGDGDKNSLTPLHIAVHEGHREVVVMLLENGANTKAISSDGLTDLSCQ
jgi:ankyrin repeat protein